MSEQHDIITISLTIEETMDILEYYEDGGMGQCRWHAKCLWHAGWHKTVIHPHSGTCPLAPYEPLPRPQISSF
jgi:hypothetical protein